jgi:nicotinamide-nucleotide amidase
MPIARILAIGDELVLGRTIDSNSAHIAARLSDAGLEVEYARTVGDSEKAITQAMRQVCRGAALVVCSGGLGPTEDDRTRHALARSMGVGLEQRPAAWHHILRWYAEHRPGKPVPEVNRRQALVPVGASMLGNDRGTAPGLLGVISGCPIACMPGVPHEMRAMLDRLLARLPRLVPGLRAPTVGEVWFAGLGESAAQERIPGLLTESDPLVGITVSELGHITLRAVGTPAQVRTRCTALRAALRPWLLPKAGLAPSLLHHLSAIGGSIAFAESCTAGHAAALFLAQPGASTALRESLIAYHEDAKVARLGVPRRLIRSHNVVSEAVARAMAEGMRRISGASIAVATTGLAGPGGGSDSTPVGTVWIAAASRNRTTSRMVRIGGNRERVQKRAAAEALYQAWDHLRAGFDIQD